MSRNVDLSIDEFYHLYNRGNDKKTIFLTDSDYQRFMLLLYLCNNTQPVHIGNYSGWKRAELFKIKRKKQLVDIIAYCLMPNHFHIVVKEITVGGISLFMQKVTTAYTMYFNRKNGRSGALLQGTFKVAHLDNDEYLKYIFAYVHLNPVKLIDPKWKDDGLKNLNKAEKFLDQYQHSSYMDYAEEGERYEAAILNKKSYPNYFDTVIEVKEYTNDWLSYVAA